MGFLLAASTAFAGGWPQPPASLPDIAPAEMTHACTVWAFGIVSAVQAADTGETQLVRAGVAGFAAGQLGAHIADLTGAQLAALYLGGVRLEMQPGVYGEAGVALAARNLLAGGLAAHASARRNAAVKIAIACTERMDAIAMTQEMLRGLQWWQRAAAVAL